MWRWPLAEPREVVSLAGAGTIGDGDGEAHLGDELRRWRGVVARRRLIALARRHAALAIGLASLLEILALLGAFPQWVVVAVPLAAFLVSVTVFARRGPSPFELARLLDDKLGLNDRLATALEIEARGGGETPLERRTVADAAALLRAGREDWHASPARAGSDWWALAAPVAALAVVVAIGLAAGGGSSSGAQEALAPGAAAGTAGGHHHARQREKSAKPQAPTGKMHKFKGRNRPEASAEEAAGSGYQKIPQGYRTKGKEVKGAGPKGAAAGKGGPQNAPTGKLRKSEDLGKPGSREGPSEGKKASTGSGGKSKAKKELGFNVKGQKHGKGGRKGASKVSGGTGNKPGAPTGKAGESTASESGSPSNVPGGTSKAGGERGTSRRGHATPIKSQASQAVRIQPGYAPSRAVKAGKERKKSGARAQGGGGKARTAQVTGATQVGDRFSYVPAAGGAVPGPSAGLQLNYLESLKWVERLPW